MDFNRIANTSERLKMAISNANIKQVDLVNKTGINRSAISRYISGEYEPKQTAIYKLARALNVSEMCVCDLAVLINVTKSAISHQLRSLKEANLVKYRKEGKNVYYSLSDNCVKEIIEKGIIHTINKI